MYDNDYIIAVNENGQPYIAHRVDAGGAGGRAPWGSKSGGRAPWGSKSGRRPLYVAKEFVNGKLRYIYERAKAGAKAGAKKAWGSKAGRFIDSHDAGISERLMSKAYGAKKRKAQKSGDKGLASYYSKRQQALKYEGRREGKAAKESIKNAGKRAVKSIDDLGVDDYIRWKRAQRRGTNSTEDLQKYQNAEYQWKNSKIGKRATIKKRSN